MENKNIWTPIGLVAKAKNFYNASDNYKRRDLWALIKCKLCEIVKKSVEVLMLANCSKQKSRKITKCSKVQILT